MLVRRTVHAADTPRMHALLTLHDVYMQTHAVHAVCSTLVRGAEKPAAGMFKFRIRTFSWLQTRRALGDATPPASCVLPAVWVWDKGSAEPSSWAAVLKSGEYGPRARVRGECMVLSMPTALYDTGCQSRYEQWRVQAA
jgi:hypothetical protein